MTDPISITVSVLALSLSTVTAWLTLLRRGTVKMTRPTTIFFGPDTPRIPDEHGLPKVYLKTLLFATAKRGRVIESLHVSLARNETIQNFNIWVFGDEKLGRGSGLFVGETGVAANHHFLIPSGATFRFTEGLYQLKVFARLLGDRKPILLFTQTLEISSQIAKQLEKNDTGLYFDWGPDSSRYLTHVDRRPPKPSPEDFLNFVGLGQHPEK